MQKIGIFAGTFDPIHKGHIAFAQAAIHQCGLEKVYFLPEQHPRTKQDVTPIDRRIDYIRQSIRHTPELGLLHPQEDQFTVDKTLPRLQSLFHYVHITLLIGSDIACTSLAHWHNLPILLSSVDFIIGMRAHTSQKEIELALQTISKKHTVDFRYTILASPHAHVSSSKIRATRH